MIFIALIKPAKTYEEGKEMAADLKLTTRKLFSKICTALLFLDGCNILDADLLTASGFEVKGMG